MPARARDPADQRECVSRRGRDARLVRLHVHGPGNAALLPTFICGSCCY